MSSTRVAEPGGAIRQERFASDPAFMRGLFANRVAPAAALLADDQARSVVFFVQWRSWQPGGLADLASEISELISPADAARLPSQAREWARQSARNRRLLAISQAEGAEPEDAPARAEATGRPSASEIADLLTRGCLEPHAAKEPWWGILSGYLLAIRARQMSEARASIAETEVAAKVWRTLDRAADTHGHCLVVGGALIGKSAAARAWCEGSGGLGRYIQIPPSNELRDLNRAVATALGSAGVGQNRRANEMRTRIREALSGAPFVLVMDDSQWFWPNGEARRSPPRRLDWLMPILDGWDFKGAVALIATDVWASRAVEYEGLGYPVGRLEGRMSRVLALPDRPSLDDCRAVARFTLRGANEEEIEAVARLAQTSKRGLGVVSEIARDAERSGDVLVAIRRAPELEAGLKAIRQMALKDRGRPIAARPPTRGSSPAAVWQTIGHGQGETNPIPPFSRRQNNPEPAL